MIIKKEITEFDCILWNKNKNINPHTNRKILSSSPIYKKFEKKCYKLIKKFEEEKEEKKEKKEKKEKEEKKEILKVSSPKNKREVKEKRKEGEKILKVSSPKKKQDTLFNYFKSYIQFGLFNNKIEDKIEDNKILHIWTFKMPILVFIILVFSYFIFLNILFLPIICSV